MKIKALVQMLFVSNGKEREKKVAPHVQASSLGHASTIAHHHTPKMVLKSLIFSTRHLNLKVVHNQIQNAYLQYT